MMATIKPLRPADAGEDARQHKEEFEKAASGNSRDAWKFTITGKPLKRSVSGWEPLTADNGKKPIHNAVLSGKCDKIRELVEAGADINARDDFGQTPLHHVCSLAIKKTQKNLGDIMPLLLELGADFEAVTYSGDTAEELARAGNTKALPYLKRIKV